MWWFALFAVCFGQAAIAQSVETVSGSARASFEDATSRYGHGIMGNLPEWSRLCLSNNADEACVTLPETSVFEDIAPRLADMDGDGQPEAVVVESSISAGAALVVYGLDGAKLWRVSTPPIGRRNRWLAPIGIADFDQDGRMDIAFVEKPHLDKTLKIYAWDAGVLKLTVRATSFSNHRIGDEFITSGLRECGSGPEMIVPDGTWSRVYSGRFDAGQLQFQELGPMQLNRFASYLEC